MDEALKISGGHLSLYQLTIEQGTPFFLAAHRGDFSMPSEDQSDQFFHWTHQYMKEQGCPSYEISNFAFPGEECRHNKHYWYYQDYIGIGPGAHSRLIINGEKYAIRRHRSPEKWLEMVAHNQGTHEKFSVKGASLVEEYLMMRLRLLEKMSFEEFQCQIGRSLFDCIAKENFKP